ncbi:hypothetical protein KIN20_023443 [Parelaphostrongylus tenuis]|uniref:BTB domain-containing protein n=1 Tax=Parelaphostrongylus tenuis TaxID=148309 RepID=A0AAD5QVV3_PARTN|nr:hypothetical protein KIN20_023443 [Parelaphostrongylus tenuis]
MPLEKTLGPPPALYTTLLSVPVRDCFVSVNGAAPIAGNEELLRRASPLFAALLSADEFQETRYLRLQLTTANAELIFTKAMNFLNNGDFEMTGCTSEQMMAVAEECQLFSLQEKAREHLLLPRLQPASHPSTMAIAPYLPAPSPLLSSFPNPFLFMSLQSQLNASNILQMFMYHLNTANQPQEPINDKFLKEAESSW